MTCGDPGIKTRTRSCTNPTPEHNGVDCSGDMSQEANCPTLNECPINGVWSEWAQWSVCSASCGNMGVIVRSRACDSPAPMHNGMDCIGEPNQENSCPVIVPCPGAVTVIYWNNSWSTRQCLFFSPCS